MSPTLLAIALWIGAPVADTAPAIEWEGPASCPSAEEVSARVRSRLGDAGAEVSGHGAVVADRQGGYRLHATLSVGDTITTRRLQAEQCSTLADAFVLLVAVAVGYEPPPEPARAPASASRLGGELGLAGLGELGLAPRVSGGAELRGSLTGRRWTLDAAAGYLAPRRTSIGDGSSVAMQRWHLAAAAGPAIRRRWGSVSFPVGVESGGWWGQGSERAVVAQRHAAFVAGRASVRAAWSVSPRVQLTAELTGLAAVTRVRYFDDRDVLLLATRRFGGRVGLGVAFRFGE